MNLTERGESLIDALNDSILVHPGDKFYAALDNLIEYMEELESAQQWRPIETAPKDWTPYLAYDSYSMMVLKASEYTPGKALCSSCEEYGASRPTHWMPLPEPPK